MCKKRAADVFEIQTKKIAFQVDQRRENNNSARVSRIQSEFPVVIAAGVGAWCAARQSGCTERAQEKTPNYVTKTYANDRAVRRLGVSRGLDTS